jgi:hypothetical protein
MVRAAADPYKGVRIPQEVPPNFGTIDPDQPLTAPESEEIHG